MYYVTSESFYIKPFHWFNHHVTHYISMDVRCQDSIVNYVGKKTIRKRFDYIILWNRILPMMAKPFSRCKILKRSKVALHYFTSRFQTYTQNRRQRIVSMVWVISVNDSHFNSNFSYWEKRFMFNTLFILFFYPNEMVKKKNYK